MPLYHHQHTCTMAASHQTQGIQQLLIAEKRADEKVSEARKRKAKRIKQARDEANADIEAYRERRETQFLEYESRYMGCSEDMALEIENDTEKQIEQIKTNVESYKEDVIRELLALVFKIEPEIHPNFFIMKFFNKI